MSKLTNKEILKRRKRMQEDALKSVAKTEQLNIRMDEDNIYRLYNIAGRAGRPVGTMVREWIIDRIKLEERAQKEALDPTERIIASLTCLESKIDHWEKVFCKQQKIHPKQHMQADDILNVV